MEKMDRVMLRWSLKQSKEMLVLRYDLSHQEMILQ